MEITGLTQTPGTGLSNTLHDMFVTWVQDRKPQEQRMQQDYDHKMRIHRDGEQKEIGGLASSKTRVFIGSTRSKIRSARSKIKDTLFGAGRMPFDAEPTHESLAEFAQAIEKILTYQLEEMDWVSAVGLGIDDASTYGTGYIGGPFARTESYDLVAGRQQGIESQKIEYRAPYFERISPMDCYPDPEAENIQEGMGVFWGSRKQPHFIRGLLGKPGYNEEAIKYALTQKITSGTSEGSDLTREQKGNLYRYSKDGRIWFVRYFGLVSVRQLLEWQGKQSLLPATDTLESEEKIEAIVQMAGGVVIKADKNPYHMMRRPIYRCAYEDEPGEVWGTGIARNNSDNTIVINSAFNLFIEGKGMSLYPMFAIDRSKFLTTEDFKRYPGKNYDFKFNLSPEERKEAIIQLITEDVTGGWEKVIELIEQFSDDDTGVTKYTQGNDADHLNKTASGISMIMNAASLPLKEVIENIDEGWIEPMINDLFQWDLEFLEPETVGAQLGPEVAMAWAKIKDFGKTSFVKLKPAGSSTFMMREVLLNKLNGFATMVMADPEAPLLIDKREMYSQIWEAAEIGKENVVRSEEEVMMMQQQQMQQQMAMQAAQMGPAEGQQPEGEAGMEEEGIPEEEASFMNEEGVPEGGLESLAPQIPPEQQMAMNLQKLESLIIMLLTKQDEANRIAMSDKVPIRNPQTGLIERLVVQDNRTVN